MKILFVALGGAVGAVLRYLISLIPIRTSFPLLTLLTNLIGAVLIGFIVGMLNCGKISENQLLFLKVGLCGGFTTFSTFSLESVQLLEQGKIISGCSYIGLSLVLCILGVMIGRHFAAAVS